MTLLVSLCGWIPACAVPLNDFGELKHDLTCTIPPHFLFIPPITRHLKELELEPTQTHLPHGTKPSANDLDLWLIQKEQCAMGWRGQVQCGAVVCVLSWMPVCELFGVVGILCAEPPQKGVVCETPLISEWVV
jgi:hypothetical protein